MSSGKGDDEENNPAALSPSPPFNKQVPSEQQNQKRDISALMNLHSKTISANSNNRQKTKIGSDDGDDGDAKRKKKSAENASKRISSNAGELLRLGCSGSVHDCASVSTHLTLLLFLPTSPFPLTRSFFPML